MRGEQAKIDKLGNGTPGLYAQLGGPSQNAVAGASPFRLSRLGGKPPVEEKQSPVRTSVFEPPVPEPFDPGIPGEGPGPGGDGGGDGGTGGDGGVGGL